MNSMPKTVRKTKKENHQSKNPKTTNTNPKLSFSELLSLEFLKEILGRFNYEINQEFCFCKNPSNDTSIFKYLNCQRV